MTQTDPPNTLPINANDVEAHISGKGGRDDPRVKRAAATLAKRAPEFATYAILSNNAYNRDKPFPLPPGWFEDEQRRPAEQSGLAYKVYYAQAVGAQVTEAAIAFRGTDDLKDWLHNITPFENQMLDAERVFKEFSREYRKPGTKIFATGHSLGGALALHMAFAFEEEVEAIAFNSSPLVRAGTNPHMGNSRTSIWEAGEVLQPVRILKSQLCYEWKDTELIRVDFDRSSSPFRQHKMEPLAFNLLRLAAPRSSAHQAVLSSLTGSAGAR